jgi:uncharacterized protein (TIGR02246 family)
MGAKTPAEIDDLLGKALADGDGAAALALYEPGATFVNEGSAITGTDAIRAVLDGFAALRPRVAMNVVAVSKIGDVAVLYNDWSGKGSTPAGEAVELAGRAIEVVRKQPDGTWKYIFDDPNGRGR